MMSMRKVLAVLFSLAAGPAFAQGTPAGNSGDFQTNAGSLRFGSATPGTGVASAFQNPINAASGFVTYSGAFGTPTSLNLTNATALPTTSLTGALQAGQFPALTGDITTSAGALATTLATVNGNVGSFGSATSCPAFTVNAKGLITAASASTCAPAIGSITGLGTGVATALGVAVGSAGAPVINGGALGTPSSGNGTNLTGLVYTALPALSANQILGALTATTPSGQSVPSCSAANNALIWTSGTGFGCNTITGAISSVSNSDGTLTISPTTGAVVASIALGHANTWTNVQTFNSGDLSATAPAFAGTFTGTYTLGGTPSIPASGLTGTALPSGIVSSSLTSVGTLSTGTWQATAVGAQWGGTGQNTSASTGIPSVSSGTWSVTTTPSFTGTNISGTAASLTAGIANAIASATTTVNTSSATAPTNGKVLTATSGTTSTWQVPTDGGGPALSLFYNALAQVNTSVVRIENLGDSITTCNQTAPCTYGPQRIGSTFALMLIDILSQRFQQYSTGYRPVVRLSNATTTVSAGDGYTLTSGSLTNSTTLGPQQSGVSLNGGSLLTLSSGGVITIAVGQPYSSVNIACLQGTGLTGYTVTINGSSVGTACGSGSGTVAATIQNFANPVAQASQPATGSTLTLTALGAANDFYAYEAVLFCGAAQSACTTGFTVDNWGVGGASSPWFASGTKSGVTDGGMVWVKAVSGKVGLCVLENGENDANASSAITSTQQNAQNQIVATDCQTLNASVLFWVPPPYNSGGAPATYAALQQGSMTYCQNSGWACLNMADLFMGDQSGTLSSIFPFTAQNTGMGLTPPWGVAQGMITNSDSQHLTDCGELLATQQFMTKVFKIWPSYVITQACSMNPQSSGISSAYTNATASFTTVQGATANTGQLEFVAPVNQTFTSVCRGYMQVGTTGVVDFQLIGSASISTINMTLSYQTAANSVYTMVSATALSSALATSSITAASGLKWVLEINGVNSTTSNSFAVQAHEASGTLTIPAGATCTTQLSGPQ
jgi:hypothetical protein